MVTTNPDCVLTPRKDEGPFFIDEGLLRSDIRADPTDGSVQAGVALDLTMSVLRAEGDCAPVEGAHVDLWQCNAHGMYSDVEIFRTVGKKYLRGWQRTDGSGAARFTTIFPGWYWSRTIHIHFKIRCLQKHNEIYDFTSQLFFDQAVIEEVHRTRFPYNLRGQPDVSNEQDDIFGRDGWKLTLPVTPDGDGYRGAISIGLSDLPPKET